MATIDKKIVDMEFNNSRFEQNIKQSIESLDNLKKGLNLKDAEKNLQSLESTGKKFSLQAVQEGIEALNAKFSTLGIIGMTALANITNSAINAGKRIVSSLTIDPVKTGFQEYETQMNAVQTILANTSKEGATLKQVNAALDELNTYADKTIYNFTEMTRNIGTFTAAGVKLDTSVEAIKGIANLAAVSGSTSQQASTAMYQLSQALSSGTVKLQDWNSVVNAGMGGQVFQDALKETAKVHGINIDKMIKEEGSFRETLSEGWLSASILTETLSKFTGDLTEEQLKSMGYTQEQAKEIIKMGEMANDAATKVKTFTQLMDTLKEAAQSGWSKSWQILVGDFEEAKEFMTDLSKQFGSVIEDSAAHRNNLLQAWVDLGGRTQLLESFWTTTYAIFNGLEAISAGIREIFPRTTAEQLMGATKVIAKLGDAFFSFVDDNLDTLQRTFRGLAAGVDIALMVLKAFGQIVLNIIKSILPAGDGILNMTANLGDFVYNLRNAIKEGNALTGVVEFMTAIFKPVGDAIAFVAGKLGDMTSGFSKLDPKPVESWGKKVGGFFINLAKNIGNFFKGMSQSITETMNTADLNPVFNAVSVGLLASLVMGVKKFLGQFSGVLDDAKGILGGLTEVFDGVKGSLTAWQNDLKSKTLMKIASAIALLAVSLIALSIVDSKKLAGALGAITTLFIELFAAMAVFDKIASNGLKGTTKAIALMNGMATAILILSAAVTNLGRLKWEDLVKGLFGVMSMMTMLTLMVNFLGNNTKRMTKGAGGMILFAVAINVLTSAVEKLSKINSSSLLKGLGGVAILLASLAAFLKVADFDGIGMTKGLGLILLATSLNILANAVGKFADIKATSLAKGLGAMTIVLAELAIFSKVAKGGSNLIAIGAGMVIIGHAMKIFADAIGELGKYDKKTLAKGLGSIAISLGTVAAAARLMPKDMISKSAGLYIMAHALTILGNTIANLGGMGWKELVKGLGAIAGVLAVITIAMHAMKGTLLGSAATLIMASALLVLVPVLKMLGSMSIGEIVKSLVALTGAFMVIGIAGSLLGLASPLLLAFAAAIIAVGVGIAAIGGGMLAFGLGMTAMAAAGTAGVTALIAIMTGILGLIPMFLIKIGEGIVAFANVIAAGVPAIMNAAKAILVGILDTVIEITPKVITAVVLFLTTMWQKLAEAVPIMVESGMKLVLGILRGIADNIQQVVEAGVDVILNFIRGVTSKLPEIIDTAFEVIITFINGLANSIRDKAPEIRAAAWNLVTAVISAIAGFYGSVIETGGKFLGSFIDGVKSAPGKLINAGKDIGGKAIQGVKDGIKGIFNVGTDMITGMINGIGSMGTKLKDKAVEVASGAFNGIKKFLGIKSPSRKMFEVGEWFDEGFIGGMHSMIGKIKSTATGVGEAALNPIQTIGDKISDYLNLDADLNPVITPVLDMDGISNELDSLAGRTAALNLSGTLHKADAANQSANRQNRSDEGKQEANGESKSVVFNQYNNSPKPLSRLEIYRQTKNQLAWLKE